MLVGDLPFHREHHLLCLKSLVNDRKKNTFVRAGGTSGRPRTSSFPFLFIRHKIINKNQMASHLTINNLRQEVENRYYINNIL